MNIKILLVAASSMLLSANAVSESATENEESSIKEDRGENPARITEADEFNNSDSAAGENNYGQDTQDMTQVTATQSASQSTSQDQSQNQTTQSQAQGKENLDIAGATVVDSNGESIGSVDTVVARGSDKMAVIALDESDKKVAVPLSDLSWENEQLAAGMSQSELKAQEEVDMVYLTVLEPGGYNIYEFARFEKEGEVGEAGTAGKAGKVESEK